VNAGTHRQRVNRHVDVGNLPLGMHSRVGAPSRVQPQLRAKNGRQRVIENAGYGALPGWAAQPAKSVPS